jgi:hypothetical protein
MMALSRTVIDGFLETEIPAAPEEIERAERGGRVWRIEHESPDHELANPSRSASDQPIMAKAERRCCSVPMSAMLTGSPGSPSPVIVKLGTMVGADYPSIEWKPLPPTWDSSHSRSPVCRIQELRWRILNGIDFDQTADGGRNFFGGHEYSKCAIMNINSFRRRRY